MVIIAQTTVEAEQQVAEKKAIMLVEEVDHKTTHYTVGVFPGVESHQVVVYYEPDAPFDNEMDKQEWEYESARNDIFETLRAWYPDAEVIAISENKADLHGGDKLQFFFCSVDQWKAYIEYDGPLPVYTRVDFWHVPTIGFRVPEYEGVKFGTTERLSEIVNFSD